jgi:hypothetical protein
MTFRLAARILGAILALIAPIFGEVLYQYRIRSSSSRLIEDLLACHAREDRPRIEVVRFGSSTAEISASLLEDLNARTARRLGRPSELDGDGCESYPHRTLAYLAIRLQWGDPGERDVHTLLWSPRRLTFIPVDDCSHCRRPKK